MKTNIKKDKFKIRVVIKEGLYIIFAITMYVTTHC